MTEVRIPCEDLRAGDVILGWWKPGMSGCTYWTGSTREYVVSASGLRMDVKWWQRLYPGDYQVRRNVVAAPPVNATFKVPVGQAGRAIPDWPLPCPRCGKANSAVTLFSTTDCRWGCFAKGAK